MRITFFYFFIVVALNGCQKQPIADFTSATYAYRAGETIHLKDASLDAYQWKWTTPDGNMYDTQDLDYVTDINDTGGTMKFTLEVSSKKGDKSNSATKTILLKQAILPTDYFAVNSSVYIPTDKSSSIFGGWKRFIAQTDNNQNLYIYFYGTSMPLAGTYSLTSNYPSSPGFANVQIFDGSNSYYSYSGQLTVIVPSVGRVRIQFNNVSDGWSSILSGDLTVH